MDKTKEFRKEGYSYSEIAKLIGKSRKFAWTHGKNTSFTNKGLKRYRKEVKGVIKPIKSQNKLSSRKVRIIGHILFDGTMYNSKYHYFVRYINSSKKLIEQFIEDLKTVYGLTPSALESKKDSKLICYAVTFKSKLLYEDLEKYFGSYSSKSVSPIPKIIMDSSKKMKIEFLRSFWEDEGSISAKGRLMADQKSEKIIKQIIKLHNDIGLYPRLCKYECYKGFIHKIYLLKNRENLAKFDKLRLFEKAIITHGKNIGKKKLDILRKHMSKF